MRKINLTNFQVATSLTARDINRRIILNVIRTRQPVSRADVARLTGLQRSTVSLIADQLIEEGWIAEGELGRLPRGRRPIYLYMNAERAGIVGVNVRPGGTTIALADLNGKFKDQETFLTERNPEDFLADLTNRVKGLIARHPGTTFEGIGVSVPGRVSRNTQRLTLAPNLGWKEIDLKTPLERATGLSVEIENAANACALAENYFGQHAAEIDNLIAVTVSEGIGTGIIANGQLLRGTSGMAGEFGHVSLDSTGPECRCGNRGCWEVMASNTAALRLYGEGEGKPEGRGKGSKLTFEQLIQQAQGGDAKALKAIDEMAKNLGRGLSMLVTGFEPSVIVMVGEITRLWDRVGPIINKAMQECGMSSKQTRLTPVDDALQPRLRGTVALVLEKHLCAPAVA